MTAWPNLPKPRADGFSEELGKGFVVFQSDKTGADKRRAVTTKAPRTMSFTMSCTATEVATLRTFYETTTHYGVDRFTFTHPVTGATVTAQFVGEPKIQARPNAPRYLAAVQLKVWA